MDPATIRFRLALPFALFPAAPTLAALHATRVRTLHPAHLSPDNPACSHCGSLLVHHLRAFKNNKKHKRFLRRSCRICGAVTLNPLPTSPFPLVRNHPITTIVLPPPTAVHSSPPSPPIPPSPTPSAPPKHQSRPKKKSGLQLLLARNRENEEKERRKQKQSNSSQLGGLAAFLTDL